MALVRVLVALLITSAGLRPGAVRASDLRHDCRTWAGSHGAQRVAVANRIGASQLLTKQHNFAVATPADTRSLYNSSDIRRLCAVQ